MPTERKGHIWNLTRFLQRTSSELDIEDSFEQTDFADWEPSWRFLEPLQLVATLRHEGDGLLHLEGKLTGRFESDCARCLSPVETTCQLKIEETCIPRGLDEVERGRILARCPETVDPDDCFTYEKQAFDLTEIVRSAIILYLPNRVICPDACELWKASSQDSETDEVETSSTDSPFAKLLGLFPAEGGDESGA